MKSVVEGIEQMKAGANVNTVNNGGCTNALCVHYTYSHNVFAEYLLAFMHFAFLYRELVLFFFFKLFKT